MINLSKEVIFINENKIIIGDSEYNYKLQKEKINFKKAIIVILEQSIYINKATYNKKQSVDNIIFNKFGDDEEYLFDYFFTDNRKNIVIYAVKGGNAIASVCQTLKKVKVIPIQLYISNKIKKQLKSKLWRLIFLFKGSYYYISYSKNYINFSIVEKRLSDILDIIKGEDNLKDLYIDSNIIEEVLSKMQFNRIDLGEFLNDRAFKKQTLYTI